MIASGGLSGGISSYIAGGNFWQGVKQGVITSGLNHAAHWVEKNIFDNGDPVPVPDASELDKAYKIDGKDWEKVKGKGGSRWTITTKKEILQWDSLHGEIEVYNKANRKHMGGFNPLDRSKTPTKAKNYTPTGGWGVNTSKRQTNFMNKVMDKSSSLIKALKVLNVYEFFPTFLLPYQVPGYNQYQIQENTTL